MVSFEVFSFIIRFISDIINDYELYVVLVEVVIKLIMVIMIFNSFMVVIIMVIRFMVIIME